MMPLHLRLVRHGESEGNVATAASLRGDDSYYTPEFLARHSRDWRLTPKGRGQAGTAGEWLREVSHGRFYTRYLVSDYLRARETAALLNLPEAQWNIDINLRERNWGEADVMTHGERQRRFAEIFAAKKRNSFLWTPPNGEDMPTVCMRVRNTLDTLHRECADGNVIIVCHGEVMWAFRMMIERLTMEEWNRLDASDDPRDSIHNCQVLEYTRVNPDDPNDIRKRMEWMRSTLPTNPSLSYNVWMPIPRRTWSNEDLLASLDQVNIPVTPALDPS